MAHEVDVVNGHIIPEVRTNDDTVVESDRHAEIVELQKIGFELADTDQAKKLAMTN